MSDQQRLTLIVCGGRDFSDVAAFASAMATLREKHPGEIIVINGGAPGADKLARAWALVEELPCVTVPAEWSKYGKPAGPMRNQRMIDEWKPGAVVAFPGGVGTADMVSRAESAGIKVWKPYG